MQPLRLVLAAIPFGALSVGVPFVNRVEPRVLGLPFVLFWVLLWVLAIPFFVWGIGRVDRRW